MKRLFGLADKIWAGIFVGFVLITSVFPIYWVAAISLKGNKDAFSMPPKWIFSPVWEHYIKLWGNELFRSTFFNSVIITVMGVFFSLLIALPTAYALARLKIKGEKIFSIWLILAYMLPEFLFVIPMFSLYKLLGLYDTHLGLALLYQVHVLPLSIWLLTSFLKEINRAIDEAAMIEGCNHWQVLTRIHLPCIMPGIIATAILNAIWIWNELAIALGLTFSKAQTVTVGVTSFRGYASLDWGGMASASIVAIIPMLLFAVVAQKSIVKGITLGAVKG